MMDWVECRSGSEYAERPVAFMWQEQRMEVVEILVRRRTPEGRLFRVSTPDGQIFDLFYNEVEDGWRIKLY